MLANRDLFREITDLNETFNRFFNHPVEGWSGGQRWAGNVMPLDMAETGDSYILKVSLPGLNPEDIDVSITTHTLTIKGRVHPDWADEQDLKFYVRERWYGEFQRSVTLPVNVKSEDIQANYEAGVLTLFLPKSDEQRPKRIPIRIGAQQKQLEDRVPA